jgi:hypothetical protein
MPPPLPDSYVAPVTRSQTTLPTVHRNAWIALGVSFTLLLIVGGAWATRLTQQRQEVAALSVLNPLRPAESQPTAPVFPAPQPTAPSPAPTSAQNPAPAAGGSNLELIPLAGANEPVTQPQQAARTEPLDNPNQNPKRQPRDAASVPRPDATLDVGVVPWGKIWIDNRLYGWTPLRGIKLHPGRHLIGAGVDSTQLVRKHINLKPGEQAVLTLQLDASGGADEATGSHNDR